MITDTIPVVGGACTVLTGVCVAVIRCTCMAARIVTIPIGNVASCPACHAQFAIVRVRFDVNSGPGITYVVDRVVVPGEEGGG